MDVFLVSLALAALDALEVRPDRRRTVLRLPRDLGHQLADDRRPLTRDVPLPVPVASVAILSDEYKPVAYAAAKTLAVIGGPNEVVAMDIWLHGVSHRDNRKLREHVQKCRDELKKRLDEAAARSRAPRSSPA